MRSRASFGQGNGPTRAKTLRTNRRTATMVRFDDERDIGIRAGVARALGIDGEREVIVDGMVVPPGRVLQALAHHWFTRAA